MILYFDSLKKVLILISILLVGGFYANWKIKNYQEFYGPQKARGNVVKILYFPFRNPNKNPIFGLDINNDGKSDLKFETSLARGKQIWNDLLNKKEIIVSVQKVTDIDRGELFFSTPFYIEE